MSAKAFWDRVWFVLTAMISASRTWNFE